MGGKLGTGEIAEENMRGRELKAREEVWRLHQRGHNEDVGA